MRILLTGARGQLGTDIAARLPERDEVVSVDLPEFDLTDRDTALGVVTQFQPDVILHCAAFTAVDLCEEQAETAWRANALATRFIADGAPPAGGAPGVYLHRLRLRWDQGRAVPGVGSPQSPIGLRPFQAGRRAGGRSRLVDRPHLVGVRRARQQHGEDPAAAGGGERPPSVSSTTRSATPPSPPTWPTWSSSWGASGCPARSTAPTRGRSAGISLPAPSSSWPGSTPSASARSPTAQLNPPRPAVRPSNSVLDNFAWRHHGFAESRHYIEPLTELLAALQT
jgi:dTDP-4-dehydrorhamnose reductase